jgi:tetratricopeptide (TPR) repeat protein
MDKLHYSVTRAEPQPACIEGRIGEGWIVIEYTDGMGIILIQIGRYPEALDAYERAIQIDAYQHRFHYSRGNVLQMLGRIEEARQAYERGNQVG